MVVLRQLEQSSEADYFENSDFWFNIGSEAIFGPILASIGGLIAGTLSDHWPSKLGKRNAFIIYGAIIYAFGCIILTLDSIIPLVMLTNNIETVVKYQWTVLGLILYIIGYLLWIIGNNMISVCYRAYILDTFDVTQQDGCNLVKAFWTGLAWIAAYLTLTITFSIFQGKEYSEEVFKKAMKVGAIEIVVMYVISNLTLLFGVVVFYFVSKEPRYEPEDQNAPKTKIESLKTGFSYIKKGFQSINIYIFSVFLIVFFGWYVWYINEEKVHEMSRTYMYPGQENAIWRVFSFSLNFIMTGIILSSVSLILFFTEFRLDLFTIISFFICAGTSSLYYFLYKDEENETTHRLHNYFCSSIPMWSVTLIYCSIKSFPYLLMSKVIPVNQYGVMMGIKNIIVNLAHVAAICLFFLFFGVLPRNGSNVVNLIGGELFVNYFTVVCPICVVSGFVSIVVYYVYKSEMEQGILPTDDYKAQVMVDEENEYDDFDNYQ